MKRLPGQPFWTFEDLALRGTTFEPRDPPCCFGTNTPGNIPQTAHETARLYIYIYCRFNKSRGHPLHSTCHSRIALLLELH